jgi:hypothetical protein
MTANIRKDPEIKELSISAQLKEVIVHLFRHFLDSFEDPCALYVDPNPGFQTNPDVIRVYLKKKD